MWIYANPNPCRQEEPDCVVRAISIATDQSWKKVHRDLCQLSCEKCTMPSVNWLWGLYLKRKGFRNARMYPEGTYVVGTGTHAVAVIGGNWYDAWDSADETLTYFYERR